VSTLRSEPRTKARACCTSIWRTTSGHWLHMWKRWTASEPDLSRANRSLRGPSGALELLSASRNALLLAAMIFLVFVIRPFPADRKPQPLCFVIFFLYRCHRGEFCNALAGLKPLSLIGKHAISSSSRSGGSAIGLSVTSSSLKTFAKSFRPIRSALRRSYSGSAGSWRSTWAMGCSCISVIPKLLKT
jgi:hypothetical protein